MKKLAIVLFVALLSCASTRMTSTLNPEYSHKSYQCFLVVAGMADLNLRQKLETRLCARLSDRGADCKKSHDMFFPGKTYTDDEIWDRVLAESIDAILVVTPLKSGVSTSKLPEREHTKTKGQIIKGPSGNRVGSDSDSTSRQEPLTLVG